MLGSGPNLCAQKIMIFIECVSVSVLETVAWSKDFNLRILRRCNIYGHNNWIMRCVHITRPIFGDCIMKANCALGNVNRRLLFLF